MSSRHTEKTQISTQRPSLMDRFAFRGERKPLLERYTSTKHTSIPTRGSDSCNQHDHSGGTDAPPESGDLIFAEYRHQIPTASEDDEYGVGNMDWDLEYNCGEETLDNDFGVEGETQYYDAQEKIDVNSVESDYGVDEADWADFDETLNGQTVSRLSPELSEF